MEIILLLNHYFTNRTSRKFFLLLKMFFLAKPAKSKGTVGLEKKEELEKRLENVAGVLAGSSQPKKPSAAASAKKGNL